MTESLNTAGNGLTLKAIGSRRPRQFAAANAVDLLRRRGLTAANRAEQELGRCPMSRIEDVAGDLFDFLEQQRGTWQAKAPESVSPFSSLASASMRGDAGCCRSECRASKLSLLARYAAAYADHVYLPVPLNSPTGDGAPEQLREMLKQTVFSILELGPLVERDLVRPLSPIMHYCGECAKRAFTRYDAGIRTAKLQAKRHLQDFEFTAVQLGSGPERILGLQMDGPPDYLDHGHLIRLYWTPPSWLSEPLSNRSRYTIPTSTVKRAGLVDEIFSQLARDVYWHQTFQNRFDAAYLTDMTGEAEFLNLLSHDDDLAVRTAALCAQLTHTVPLFTNVPIPSVLRIRDEAAESFESYRSTLRGLVADYVVKNRTTTKAEAHDLYWDVLEPALAQLRVQASKEYKRWARKSIATAALAMGVVALGATGVLQTPQVLGLLGGATAMKLVDQFSDTPETGSARNSNLWFLLRLEKEAKKRTKKRDR